jgi:hypothetical protein
MQAAMDAFSLIRAQRGMLSRIAEALGITRGAVAQWTRVPAERVLEVERVTNVPRHDLRPDLYPDAPRTGTRG